MREILVPGACVIAAVAGLAVIGAAAGVVRLIRGGARALADSGRDENGGSL